VVHTCSFDWPISCGVVALISQEIGGSARAEQNHNAARRKVVTRRSRKYKPPPVEMAIIFVSLAGIDPRSFFIVYRGSLALIGDAKPG